MIIFTEDMVKYSAALLILFCFALYNRWITQQKKRFEESYKKSMQLLSGTQKAQLEKLGQRYSDQIFQVYIDFLTHARENNKRWVIYTNTFAEDVKQIELYKIGLVAQNTNQINIIVTIPKLFNKDSCVTIKTDRVSEYTEIEGLEALYNIINAK